MFSVVGTVLVLVLVARAVLPFVLQRYVERVLDGLEGYGAVVGDVDLALFRGAYVIEDVTLDKEVEPGDRTPFLYIQRMDISVQWEALLDGAVVCELELEKPVVNVERAPSEAESQTGEEADWRKGVEELVPFELNRLSVRQGFVHYVDTTTDPGFDLFLDDGELEVRDLTNRPEDEETGERVPATLNFSARVSSGALVTVSAAIDPLAELPRFDVDASLRGLDLPEWNDFFRALGGFDFETGAADILLELAAEDGRVHGYVQPMFTDLDVLSWGGEEPDEDILDVLWEGIVGAGAELIENQSRDTLAARVPLDGVLDNPEVDTWAALASLLRNAFVSALIPRLDDTVGLPALDRWQSASTRRQAGATPDKQRGS